MRDRHSSSPLITSLPNCEGGAMAGRGGQTGQMPQSNSLLLSKIMSSLSTPHIQPTNRRMHFRPTHAEITENVTATSTVIAYRVRNMMHSNPSMSVVPVWRYVLCDEGSEEGMAKNSTKSQRKRTRKIVQAGIVCASKEQISARFTTSEVRGEVEWRVMAWVATERGSRTVMN
ncbi:hypothetical protein BLNAU_24699 [Blattamonas nauphoetae]|uniref:Uncharacterized protein n=1 Tax=Blattamonas nauphoetae TaxID=2049346 RepID=A0ABQ9WLP2_9EUKA|nr:hypothetical protein BLNAU_24699 [Blattamonas nauphoetae]